ncbi:unnamed protein product [Urochloa humidicola]
MASLHVAVAGRALTVVERDGTHDPSTGRVLTGSWLWDASLVLTSHLAASASALHHLRGATVLELGAGGTGVPGIAAVACLGAARYVLTDVAALLPGLIANADANGLTAAAQADVRELRWGDRLEEKVLAVDVVLMSDVFYMARRRCRRWRPRCGACGGGGTAAARWGGRRARCGTARWSAWTCSRAAGTGVRGGRGRQGHQAVATRLRDPDQTAAFAVYRVCLRQEKRVVDFDCSPSC